jgi:S1-C subfamily serine protease
MPRARRTVFVPLLLAAVLGSALTLGVVFAAGGFDDGNDAPDSKTTSTGTPALETGAGAQSYARAVYQARVGSVVTVLVTVGKNGVQTSGGGFVANARRGLIVTASHVVTTSDSVKHPQDVQEYGPIFVQRADGARAPAKILGYDLFDDIAVLQYDPDLLPMPQTPMGNSSDVRIGDPVAAIGAPFGQVESLSSGIVSQIGTQIIAPAAVCLRTTDGIQTDTAINPGNSGGPLFDAAGKVIGVNSQIDTGGVADSNTGVSFAVPVNAARRSLEEIAATRHVHYAWLGIGGITLTADIASALQGRATSGVLVSFVEDGSAAAEAGITPGSATTTVNGRPVNSEGDVIVAFAGTPIRTLEDLQRAVSRKRPGDRVTVKWWHGATLRSRSITLGERKLTDPEVCRATATQ